ncbi:MAG: AMP-binding protein [Pseudomonadota bacterium]
MKLTYGGMLDAVAPLRADQLALSTDDGDFTWAEFDQRTNALARGFAEMGVKPGDKICFLLPNSTAFVDLLGACFKGRFVHVNANFRYQSHELEYILDNSDSVALVFDPRFAQQVTGMSSGVKERLLLIEGSSSTDPVLAQTTTAKLIASHDGAPLNIERSSDDLVFIYTGGTTGMPKGVMWQQKEQIKGLLAGRLSDGVLPQTVEDFVARLDEPKPFERVLVASPLMHAAGMYAAINALFHGGHVVITDNADRFNAAKHWELIDKYQVDALGLIGDAFAKPLLDAFEAGTFDGSSLRLMASSGALWSREVKLGLLKHLPQLTLYDSLGSSEAQSFGVSMMTADSESTTSEFKIGDDCRVVREDGKSVEPGSGEVGMLVRDGAKPLGYYKDKAKTAALFQDVEGRRFIKTGDMCTVDADGTVQLLGRGSQCINTGGEKVFPGEVEAVIVQHPKLYDALVFGVSDPKWGQAVQAVARVNPNARADADEIRQYLRQFIAGYKIPKRIVITTEDLRLANGKPAYDKAKALFAEAFS